MCNNKKNIVGNKSDDEESKSILFPYRELR